MVYSQVYLIINLCLPCVIVTSHLIKNNLRKRLHLAVRLACRSGSGNRRMLTHISVVQEIQAGCKCQGSSLSDPLSLGRLHFLKVSQSLQTQPSPRNLFKHSSLREVHSPSRTRVIRLLPPMPVHSWMLAFQKQEEMEAICSTDASLVLCQMSLALPSILQLCQSTPPGNKPPFFCQARTGE